MSRTIRFTISDEQYEAIQTEARARGLSPSAYSKSAVFAHMNKYASKGVMYQIAQKIAQSPGNIGSEGNSEIDP